MHPHVTSGIIGAAAAVIVTAASMTLMPVPKPVIVNPQTVITTPANPTEDQSAAAQRKALAAWGNLDQREIDALSVALGKLERKPLTIFCWRADLCGDMQLDFDNAFETAHWDTKLETPLIDDTIGVATSDPKLRDAINAATHGRLEVKIIQKTAPYEVLAIGRKDRKQASITNTESKADKVKP